MMNLSLPWNLDDGQELLLAAGFTERALADGLEFRRDVGGRPVVVYVRDHRPADDKADGVVDNFTRVYEAIIPNVQFVEDVSGDTPLQVVSAGLRFVTVDARNLVALAQNQIHMASSNAGEVIEDGFELSGGPLVTMPFCDDQYGDFNAYPIANQAADGQHWMLVNPADVYGASYLEWRDALALRTLSAAPSPSF